MTVNRTTLLDLPLPVTGTESGTWGDTTNNGLTQYLDIAIAGTLVLSTDADVTLTSTEGDSSATNIGATTAQYAILRWTATGSTTRNITALAQSKTYVVINATGGTQSIVLRGAGPTTGVTIISGEKAHCVWNGSDFVKVSSSAAAGGSNTQVQYNSSGVLAGVSGATTNGTAITFSTTNLKLQGSSTGVSSFASANSSATDYTVTFPAASTTIPVATQTLTFSGPTAARTITLPDANFTAARTDSAQTFTGVQTFSSNPILSGGTANGVLYLNGSKVATSGSALTFDGSRLGVNGTPSNTGIDTGDTTAFVVAPNSNFGPALTLVSDSLGRGLVVTNQGKTISGVLNTNNSLVNVGSNSATDVVFVRSASEQMRLTSTGLGIGTSSPVGRLNVEQSADGFDKGIVLTRAGANYGTIFLNASNDTLNFGRSGSTSMTLTTSGNLGLGVTPSAWGSGQKALQVGNAALMQFNILDATYVHNAYHNGTNWIYSSSYEAEQYRQVSGQHQWYTAPSGTAGNAITFTQAMTLDASGNLALGSTSILGNTNRASFTNATSAKGVLAIQNTSTSGYSAVELYDNAGSQQGAMGWGNGSVAVSGAASATYLYSTGAITFLSGGTTERARITSGGDLLVGATAVSDQSKVLIAYSSGSNQGLIFTDSESSTGKDAVRFKVAGSTVGSISTSTTATAYNTSSDYRLKDNPQPLTGSGAFIDALKPKTWNWKADGSRGVGFIAHEVQEVSPGSVVGEKDGEQMQAMEYGSAEFIANIIAELQSLRQRVALLEGN